MAEFTGSYDCPDTRPDTVTDSISSALADIGVGGSRNITLTIRFFRDVVRKRRRDLSTRTLSNSALGEQPETEVTAVIPGL